jgi:hypothetical protein
VRRPQRAGPRIWRVRRLGTVDPLPVLTRGLVVAVTGRPDEVALRLWFRVRRLRGFRRRVPATG